jgi:hypothetical protein
MLLNTYMLVEPLSNEIQLLANFHLNHCLSLFRGDQQCHRAVDQGPSLRWQVLDIDLSLIYEMANSPFP